MIKDCLKNVLVAEYIDKEPEILINFRKSFEQNCYQDVLLHLCPEDLLALNEIENEQKSQNEEENSLILQKDVSLH